MQESHISHHLSALCPLPYQALDEVHIREDAQRQAWREEQRRREEEDYLVGGQREECV
jgi:hypothetical protein